MRSPSIIRTPNGPVEPVESKRLAYTSFAELGGRFVELDDVRSRLTTLQLDLVLGVLARISAHHMRDGDDFFKPEYQGLYLAYAIADDFPAPLPKAAEMYVPNRVPITGNRHLFIHEHGLAALTQLAIVHCRASGVTPEISIPDIGHVCRLLLILNDHLFLSEQLSDSPPLLERRRFAVNSLYYAQFNQVTADVSGPLALGRLHQLLTVHLPRHLPGFESVVHQNVGLPLKQYLLVAALLLAYTPAYSAGLSQRQSPWMSIESFVSTLRTHSDEVRFVLRMFSQTRDEFLRMRPSDPAPSEDLLDFELLQLKPLIEARPAEMIWPVMSLFLRQILTFPLQTIGRIPGGIRALGNAYEDYAHALVTRIAAGDARGKWQILRGHTIKERTTKKEKPAGEVDSLLWRDGVVVIFEHKAGNLVLTLGSRDTLRNALGPNDEELRGLPNIPRKDSGAITNGLWQIARVAPFFDNSMAKRFRSEPKRVMPVITNLQPFEVDNFVREAYVNPLLSQANVKLPPKWSQPDWMSIFGLEALAQLADDGRLDLIALLEGRKTSKTFVRYLADRFNGVPPDATLIPVTEKLFAESRVRYMPG